MRPGKSSLAGGLVLFFLLSNSASLLAEDRINVFVSVPPQKYFVKRIGANHVDVSVMVKTTHNPVTYEPTPKQMTKLASTELFFLIGVPFESVWADVFAERYPQMRLIRCCNIDVKLEDHHDHGHNGGGNADPHIWTSPIRAATLADEIYAQLSKLKPSLKNEFAGNHADLLDALALMDEKIKSRLSNKKQRAFIVSHPAWGYFAHDYKLRQISLEEYGREVNAKKLVDIIEFAKTNKIDTLFVQPQFNQNAAKILAKEINAEIISLDPLAGDYLTNIDYMSDAIANSLK